MRYELKEDNPGDKVKYGVDVLIIGNNEYEFQAFCDFRKKEIQDALIPYNDDDKFVIIYRDGTKGKWQKKSLRGY